MSNSKTSLNVDNQRKLELQQRRAKGEISCAECRRLKLKCDKKIPCTSCNRRGCPTICPNGVLSAGQGTRFVLADTNTLHERLAEMSERIRQLEEALTHTYASQSLKPHRLLSDELLSIKSVVFPLQQAEQRNTNTTTASVSVTQPDEMAEVLETFGTLRIDDDGSTRFLGASAASEGLLLLQGHDKEGADPMQPFEVLLPPGVDVPFLPIPPDKDEAMSLILSQLPTWERASGLCEVFFHNTARYCGLVTRAQMLEDLIPVIYHKKPLAPGKAVSPHDVALVFAFFAIGAAGDLTLPPINKESETYTQLCRAALSLQSVLQYTSLSTVQAIALLATVNLATTRTYTLEESWKLSSYALLLAKSIGLHRDPSRWNLGEEAVDMRRTVFWELYNADSLQSLSSGRPPIFMSKMIDVEFPEDKRAQRSLDGHLIPGFARARFRFVKEVFAPVSERLCSCAEPLRYIDILKLDRKIREFDDLGIGERYNLPGLSDPKRLENAQMSGSRQIAILYLHRNFGAKALMDNPTDPLKHAFAPSFLAAYRSASTIIRLYDEYLKATSGVAPRFWPAFAHILACGALVGSIATLCPNYPLAQNAYQELEVTIEAFRNQPEHPVSKRGLPILYRIRERAYRARFGCGIIASSGTHLHEGTDEQLEVMKGGPVALIYPGSNASQLSPERESQIQRQRFDIGAMLRSNQASHPQDRSLPLHPPGPTTSITASPHSMSLSNGLVGFEGDVPQGDADALASSILHPDVFQWVADMEGANANFDHFEWFSSANEAASMVVSESDLAASMAMLQEYSSGPPDANQSLSNLQTTYI